MTDWDPSAVAAVLRTENRFPGGSVVGVLAVGHAQTRMWVLESDVIEQPGSPGSVACNPVILAESTLDEVGGELFDRLLFDRATARIADVPGADTALVERLRTAKGQPWRGLRETLMGQVRQAREDLTAWHSATVDVDDIPGLTPDGPLRLDRIELDNALRPYVLKMARGFASTIDDSGRRPSLLDGIYLLGDGRMPLIVRSVYDVLGVSPTVGQDLVASRTTGTFAEPLATNGVARPAPVPGPARPVSPAEGLSLRPTPKPRTPDGRLVVPGNSRPAPEPVEAPGGKPSRDPEDEVYRPGSETSAVQIEDALEGSGASVTSVEGLSGAGPAGKPGAGLNGSARGLNGHGAPDAEEAGADGAGSRSGGSKDSGSKDSGSKSGGSKGSKEAPRNGSGAAVPGAKTTRHERAAKVNGGPRKKNGVPVRPSAQAVAKARAENPDLTDSGALRLLGYPGDGFDVEAASAQPRKRKRRLVPVLGGVSGLVAVGLVTAVLVQNGTIASSGSTETAMTSTPTVSPTPTGLAAVAGLTAEKVGAAITLTWGEVAGANSYAVYRDRDTDTEPLSTVTTAEATDRPGDGKTHTYTVVALDADEIEGAAGETVEAKADTPYGKLQSIASEWAGIVAAKPGKKGDDGQVCRPRTGKVQGSQGRIVCTYPNKLTITVFSYGTEKGTDRRFTQLKKLKSVANGKWNVQGESGRLLTGGTKESPWRWWSYESAPSYGVQAQWPDHTKAQLAQWVKKRMPFRS